MELTGIKRLLVPVAWTLVVALVLSQLALVLWLVVGPGPQFDAGPAWLSALLVLVVGLAVGWADAGSGARTVALTALVVIVTSTAVQLGMGALSLLGPTGGMTDPGAVVAQAAFMVGTLLVPVLAIVVLTRLLPLTAETPASAPQALPAAPEPEAPGTTAPVWQPDRAAGVAWHTAGAAATGAAAADWGRPGERGGWTAAERPGVAGRPEPGRVAGVAPPERVAGTPPRPPVDFGPRARPEARQGPTVDADATGVAPGLRGGGESTAATGRPEDIDPGPIARPPGDRDRERSVGRDEDLTRPAPPGARRQPPRWTPLEDPTQPPPES